MLFAQNFYFSYNRRSILCFVIEPIILFLIVIDSLMIMEVLHTSMSKISIIIKYHLTMRKVRK